MRKPWIVGNWKMNTNLREAVALVNQLRRLLDGVDGIDVGVAPPLVYLLDVFDQVRETPIRLGAQNIYPEAKGAFTGEVSGWMLRDCGCSFVIVGHSERRQLLGESDELVARKVLAALAVELSPLLCVGETLEQRERGVTATVVRNQLDAVLQKIEPAQVARLTVAYEPVWAIGTGRMATPAQAQEVHKLIRDAVSARAGEATAREFRILYGGSVKPDNVKDLMTQPDVDGALVGGASLDAEGFAAMAKASRKN